MTVRWKTTSAAYAEADPRLEAPASPARRSSTTISATMAAEAAFPLPFATCALNAATKSVSSERTSARWRRITAFSATNLAGGWERLRSSSHFIVAASASAAFGRQLVSSKEVQVKLFAMRNCWSSALTMAWYALTVIVLASPAGRGRGFKAPFRQAFTPTTTAAISSATSSAATSDPACIGLRPLCRRVLSSLLTESRSHGAGGVTSSRARRNSAFRSRSIPTLPLHASSQLACAPLQPAFDSVQAGSGRGRNLLQRKIEVPVQNKNNALSFVHRHQSPPELETAQDGLSRLLGRAF